MRETGLRDRKGEVLFLDARQLGFMKDRVLRDFTAADLEKIAGTYRAWKRDPRPASGHPLPVGEGRGEGESMRYQDVAGFCKSATLAEIASHGFVLTPGRYVGAEDVADDGEPFEEKMQKLVAELASQFTDSARLETQIRANLKDLGYGG